MRTDTHGRVTLVLAAAFAALASAAMADPPTRVALDSETVVGGVGVGCTGIGQTKDDPKWLAYPVRVEFADAQRAYLANETLTLTDPKGEDVLTVSCEGPWILLKLPTGVPYKVEARLNERDTAPRTAVVKAPSHGQARFVITFPDAH
jgi:hypothetical protein